MSMMPPGGVGRIDRKLIHRSAWKKNSQKFAVASNLTRAGVKASGRCYTGFLRPSGTALDAFVTRICSKRLRLDTDGLLEKVAFSEVAAAQNA
jgi:hypothetical protein